MNANYRLEAPPPTRRTAIVGYPKVTSYDMLGEQLHNSNPAKHRYAQLISVNVSLRPTSNFVFNKSKVKRSGGIDLNINFFDPAIS